VIPDLKGSRQRTHGPARPSPARCLRMPPSSPG